MNSTMGMMMTTKMTMTFNYSHLKTYLAHKIGVSSDDPDFEDRYHDSLELWLRHWNGAGTAHGAVCLYFQQWYSHKRRAKYHSLIVLSSSLVRDDDEEHDLLDQVFSPDVVQEQYCAELLYRLSKILKDESERTQVIVTCMLQGDRAVDVATSLGMTRQRVEQIYLRVLTKLINTI